MTGVHGSKYPYYRAGESIPVDEDFRNEFKGHVCFSAEHISKVSQEYRTKKPISRNIAAFINTGQGGNIYLGVTDDGTIKGIEMTRFKKRHIYEAMWYVLDRYTPRVPREQVELFFIPVLDHHPTDEELKQLDELDQVVGASNPRNEARAHIVRNSKPCWCDSDIKTQLSFGIKVPPFVAYIKVHPWRKGEVTGPAKITDIPSMIHPIYEDEEGVVYMRKEASVIQLSLEDVYEMTIKEVQSHYEKLHLSQAS